MWYCFDGWLGDVYVIPGGWEWDFSHQQYVPRIYFCFTIERENVESTLAVCSLNIHPYALYNPYIVGTWWYKFRVLPQGYAHVPCELSVLINITLEFADLKNDWNIILLIMRHVKQRHVKYISPKETLEGSSLRLVDVCFSDYRWQYHETIRWLHWSISLLRKMSCNFDLRCLCWQM